LKIKVDFENIDEVDLDDKLQLNIYRIVQEQMNNILKHAKATHALINISLGTDDITMTISDDGEGCVDINERKGVGLINIQSRVDLFDGKMMIDSKPGKGYELKVVIPFIKPEAD
jgi:signal transduction histidine kinase